MSFYPQHGNPYSYLGLWSAPTWPRPQDPGPLWAGLCLWQLPPHTIWLPQRVYSVSGGIAQRGEFWIITSNKYSFKRVFFLKKIGVFLCVSLSVDVPRGPEPSAPRSRCWRPWASTHLAPSRPLWGTLSGSARRPCQDVCLMWPEPWWRKLPSSSRSTGMIPCCSAGLRVNKLSQTRKNNLKKKKR